MNPDPTPGFTELVPAPGHGRVFEREVVPGLADATGSGRIRLDAIARWLQDVAYADVVDAGLAGRGAWVVRRARMRVEAFPRFGEPIRVHTFCSAAGRLAAERRTSVSGGAAAVEAVALWIHVDTETLRPLRLGEDFQGVYGESASSRRANFRLRHPAPPDDAARSPWRFRAADVDVAGHVNNAVYWEPVEELFLAEGEPEAVDTEIEYREPAQPGDAAVLRSPGALWVTGAGGTVHASILGAPSGQ
ncbi:MAG: acyl-ACP thioesterase domain-containing protein [Candidatus Limnocylindria bacterium]